MDKYLDYVGLQHYHSKVVEQLPTTEEIASFDEGFWEELTWEQADTIYYNFKNKGVAFDINNQFLKLVFKLNSDWIIYPEHKPLQAIHYFYKPKYEDVQFFLDTGNAYGYENSIFVGDTVFQTSGDHLELISMWYYTGNASRQVNFTEVKTSPNSYLYHSLGVPKPNGGLLSGGETLRLAIIIEENAGIRFLTVKRPAIDVDLNYNYPSCFYYLHGWVNRDLPVSPPTLIARWVPNPSGTTVYFEIQTAFNTGGRIVGIEVTD